MEYILNGPVILIICIIGSILNIFAIYVLATQVFPTRGLFKMDSRYSINTLRMKKSRGSRVYRTESPCISKKIRRSRIFTHLIWLTGCDADLLICSIFNFSIPILINTNGNVYMRSIPYWYVNFLLINNFPTVVRCVESLRN